MAGLCEGGNESSGSLKAILDDDDGVCLKRRGTFPYAPNFSISLRKCPQQQMTLLDQTLLISYAASPSSPLLLQPSSVFHLTYLPDILL
ncbi:hypothetical protein ANN_14658 [Periplaneta americana]|uniref:Uncharacterized protein n=1 Tax=Periplaneta americana TaxID=6978 RepID=A0ABQ8SY48_PERAM|nr:hypothetical protein ANN_14658 [Periplaneta americana]